MGTDNEEGKVTEQEAVADAEVNAAAEEEAFLAEMSDDSPSSTDEKLPVEEENKEVKTEEVSETSDDDEDKEPERVEVIPGYTAEEIGENFARLDKLQKSIDTTNGTFGNKFAEQKLIIEELKKGNTGVVGHLDPKILEKLGEEFPEIAELLKSDSGSEIHGEKSTFDPELIGKTVDERVSKFRQEVEQREQARELRALTKEHSDWKGLAMFSKDEAGVITWDSPEFGAFVGTLPEEDRTQLTNVWNPELVTETITAFKASLKKPKEKKKNKPDLNDAVRAQGLRQKVATSEEDEEDAAYRKEMAEP